MPFPIPGLNTALFALLLRPNRTQQFQKNTYHNEKCVISEPPQKACTSTRKAPSPLTLGPNMVQYSHYGEEVREPAQPEAEYIYFTC